MVIVKEKIIASKIAKEIRYFQIQPPIPLLDNGQHFGVDPGTVNVGFAELGRGMYINAFQVKLIRKDNPADRILDFYKLMSECFHNYAMPNFAVIEGASFGDKYRQAELAEIRASATFWFNHYGVNIIKFLQPQTVRKLVFGNGRTKAHMVWTELPFDAAAAISCAYASMLSRPLTEYKK